MATSDERLALFKQEYPIHDDVAMCCSNRSTIGGFFLAGRSMVFFPIGASLFVSNIGTEHFIGLSGSGAASGIGVGAWEFNAILLLQLLGWTYTMPEYLTKRFGGERLRVYFAVLSLILYIFTKCSGDLFTGALFIQQSLRWNLYLCILVLVVITGILTMTGGLTAVIYTDTMQCALMVGGGLWLMVESFKRIGGYDGLVRKYPNATTKAVYRLPNETCHETDKYSFQVIVQRLLAAKSLSHAQGATLMAGFIKVLPLFMMVMPGMISRILYADEVACVDPEICNYVCQSEAGLRGLMMAVMIAALMSDLDSIFNSASTLFTVDIYTKIRKSCSQREQMVVGRHVVYPGDGWRVYRMGAGPEGNSGRSSVYLHTGNHQLSRPTLCSHIPTGSSGTQGQ
ncbi:SC5A3-like protein [Mya arenaria]|uniref:SC5A3-like protein n=1 Tax=Mya arenaria TaxID=6604 RepID=A0ABY7F128_MYAAR|nr:SC5A3-like protein [Mya arenaria]